MILGAWRKWLAGERKMGKSWLAEAFVRIRWELDDLHARLSSTWPLPEEMPENEAAARATIGECEAWVLCLANIYGEIPDRHASRS